MRGNRYAIYRTHSGGAGKAPFPLPCIHRRAFILLSGRAVYSYSQLTRTSIGCESMTGFRRSRNDLLLQDEKSTEIGCIIDILERVFDHFALLLFSSLWWSRQALSFGFPSFLAPGSLCPPSPEHQLLLYLPPPACRCPPSY